MIFTIYILRISWNYCFTESSFTSRQCANWPVIGAIKDACHHFNLIGKLVHYVNESLLSMNPQKNISKKNAKRSSFTREKTQMIMFNEKSSTNAREPCVIICTILLPRRQSSNFDQTAPWICKWDFFRVWILPAMTGFRFQKSLWIL